MKAKENEIRPLEASLFKPLESELKTQLIQSGVVPVNDIFLPVWDNKNKINILYGSWGSGKSVFIVDVLINHAINDEYFRCYFGRKVLEDVRGTVFKTITDRIKELKKEHLFTFSDAPNGSMIIVCKQNKNEFIPFGSNNADSLLSIKDPTHFFCEELNQFSFEDFGSIYSRLRTEKADTQFYGAFNTEKVYQSHWIRQVLFDGDYADQAFRLKANYNDNYFINQQDYYEKLRLIANGDEVRLNAIARGEWGAVRTGGEFWKQFDETKHVKPIEYKPGVIYLSLDENVVPYVTCSVWQVNGQNIKQIKEILCKSPDNNAPKAAAKVCNWLDSIGHQDMVFVCGDPSASKRSTVDENSKSFYDKFCEVLKERGYKYTNKVMRSAPEVALSGAFVNAILENNLFGWSISISNMCFQSIEDYIMVKEDAEGKMLKEVVKDPGTNQTYQKWGHLSDCFRYLVLTILEKEFQQYKGGKTSIRSKMGAFR